MYNGRLIPKYGDIVKVRGIPGTEQYLVDFLEVFSPTATA